MFTGYVALFCAVVLLWSSTALGRRSSCERLFNPVHCGVPKLQPHLGAVLPTRPSEAIRGEFPWHAALYHEQDDGSFKYCCGGSLVTERFVLTAAHCVMNRNNGYRMTVERLKVKLGVHELGASSRDECVQEMAVRKIRAHEEYQVEDFKHDLALVELSQRVIFTERVLPICVDMSESEDNSFYRQHGKVAGWGYTELDAVSDWLRMTELPFINYTNCLGSNTAVFANTIYEGMFCAGYANGTSVCNGDSGGGLVAYNRDRWVLRGIVSFTALRDGPQNVCDTQEYAGFIKVRYYRNWLRNVLREAAQEDHTEAPKLPEELQEPKVQDPCGERKINKRGLIVNGVRSFAGEWPWHVAIYEINGRTKRYICGGTLISDQYVMTAAHCVLDENRQQRQGTIVVQLGQDDLYESSRHMREVRVGKITPHEGFDPVTKTNDIAMLELTANVQFNDYVQPACLPERENDEQLNLRGSLGTIVGWGYEQPWSFMISNLLQATRLPIVEVSKCVTGKDFGAETTGVLCVGSLNGSNACTGDSGGGMFFEKDGLWIARGVISALDTVNGFCNPDGYLKVANTAHFLKWIKKQVQKALETTEGNGNREMSFLQTGTDYATTPNAFSTPPPYPSESHIHHHHHHHHHYHGGDSEQQQQQQRHHRRHRHRCKKQDGDNSSNSSSGSNESGLRAPIKKIFKKKKCFIKDLKDTLLSKLF